MQNIKIGSGLHNLGNTCFFNAIMQIILYTPALARVFNSKDHSLNCMKSDWCIFCNMQKLWHDSKKSRVVSPNIIVSNLRFIFKKFRLGRQQDSHQFLRYLIEGMQDAQTGKLGKDRQKNQMAICKTRSYRTFGGKMRTFVLCLNCHHKSLTTQRYYDLSIQCQRSNSLQEGIDNFFRVDDLTGSNKYRCDNCKQLSNAKKGFKIISIPQVITFQFKRFTNSLRKIGKNIEYPRILNLNRYMEHETDTQKTKLELYGVVVHAGSSAGSGHYYAFVRNGHQWFEMNDSNVSRCTEDRVLRQQAYLLFYAKPKQDHTSQNGDEIMAQRIDIMINVKNGISMNGESKHKVEQKTVHKSLQPQKERKRKKSIQMKPVRKQSYEQFQQTKRKLSVDIEQLKQQARKQESKSLQKHKNDKNNHKNSQNRQSNKLQLNGKAIDAPIFGKLMNEENNKKGHENIENSKSYVQVNRKQDDSDQYLQVPSILERRRSKQQALSTLNIMELVLLYASQIEHIQSKIPRRSHRVLRSVNKLRKFQISSKRRKLNSDA